MMKKVTLIFIGFLFASSSLQVIAMEQPGTAKILELRSKMFQAASDGDFNTLKQILSEGRSLGITKELLEAGLFGAVRGKKIEVCKYFINKGANLNFKLVGGHFQGETPLSKAVMSDSAAISKLLLLHGADVDLLDGSKQSVLAHALYGNNAEIVVIILAALPISEREKILKKRHEILHAQWALKQLALHKDVTPILKKMFTTCMIDELVDEQMQRIKAFIKKNDPPGRSAEVRQLLKLDDPVSYEKIRRQVWSYIMHLVFGEASGVKLQEKTIELFEDDAFGKWF